MTEEDIEKAQQMVTEMTKIIGRQATLHKRMQKLVVDYQKFIVDHITGVK